MNVAYGLIAIAFLLYLDIILVCILVINKVESDEERSLSLNKKALFLNALLGTVQKPKKKINASGYFEIKQSIRLDKLKTGNIEKVIDVDKLERRQISKLKSKFETVRIRAAVSLGLLGTENARKALEKSIIEEGSYPAKLYMANSLADIAAEESIPVLVESLQNAHRWYRDRANSLISDFGRSFDSYLPQIIRSNKIEIMELIVSFSSTYFNNDLKEYLINILDNREEKRKEIQTRFGSAKAKYCANCIYGTTMDTAGNRICRYKGVVESEYMCRRYKLLPVSVNSVQSFNDLVYKAADILARVYPKVLDDEKYLDSSDVVIRNIAIKALSALSGKETINKLVSYLKSDETSRSAIYAISVIIERSPEQINTVVKWFESENAPKVRQRLAEVLSGRIEYFIMRLNSQNKKSGDDIIRQILLLGRSSEVIDFLNKNSDIDIENELLAIVKEVIHAAPPIADEFRSYLNERLTKKCGLERRVEVTAKKAVKKDKVLLSTQYILLAASLLLFPIIYLLRHSEIVLRFSFKDQLRVFVIDYNYYLIFYLFAINAIYIGLLVISLFQARKQQMRWKVKNTSMLFKSHMLPSVSIIAPAFNEEKTIIESANSLLNLKYPDYELIIVNDGSRDRTLEVLIKYFDLTRVDHIFENRLNTKPVRGIYKNSSIPKLIVVDKVNGGKADSLNAGINISAKEYFCGIDADSLIESDALLKLASVTLDEGTETPAIGGNVFPINGCTVERGQISEIKVPRNWLAKIQTVEYVRAFMAGRLGWASLNSLLIISGAFGLFRKERIISAGGYLTSTGKYAKDTVGEDMELVVRITRLMRELKQKYRIGYVFNANCWTEVPEDVKSLRKQRYRWHRGLIEILSFHKRMIFNPRYGRIGMLAMPYFFFFEMIGPLIEVQGYLMAILALIVGALSTEMAILLFIASILLGGLISIASLLIAEKDVKYFKLKEVLILVAYSIIENLGPRQLLSLWRTGAYLSMLRKQGGWEKAERKGFAASNTAAKV